MRCVSIILYSLIALRYQYDDDPKRSNKASSLQYGYKKMRNMQECFHERFHTGTATMKENKETDEHMYRRKTIDGSTI